MDEIVRRVIAAGMMKADEPRPLCVLPTGEIGVWYDEPTSQEWNWLLPNDSIATPGAEDDETMWSIWRSLSDRIGAA